MIRSVLFCSEGDVWSTVSLPSIDTNLVGWKFLNMRSLLGLPSFYFACMPQPVFILVTSFSGWTWVKRKLFGITSGNKLDWMQRIASVIALVKQWRRRGWTKPRTMTATADVVTFIAASLIAIKFSGTNNKLLDSIIVPFPLAIHITGAATSSRTPPSQTQQVPNRYLGISDFPAPHRRCQPC